MDSLRNLPTLASSLDVCHFNWTAGRRVYEKTAVVPRMLRLLPRLAHLDLDLQCDDDYFWVSQPEILKTSLHAAFSRNCFRSLCLTDVTFADGAELESLLSHAIGLKALTLGYLHFRENSAIEDVDVPREPHIVLESLRLHSFKDVDELLSSFRIVDIKHLRSLVVVHTPILPILKINSQTLQQVRISFADETPSDPDILQGNQTLRSIEIRDFDCASLQLFGSLRHLKELKAILLSFKATWVDDPSRNAVDWANVNALLAEAGEGLEDVFVAFSASESSLASGPPDMILVTLVKQRLPAVAGKISLKEDTFPWDNPFGPHL
ncbi:hypothetical protein C8J57DRAFT_1497234 [Mycena rebaudengoi]|nr:hypothetical protein C8J57DRAFT_1497234 [Mycena rebaudengoi]